MAGRRAGRHDVIQHQFQLLRFFLLPSHLGRLPSGICYMFPYYITLQATYVTVTIITVSLPNRSGPP